MGPECTLCGRGQHRIGLKRASMTTKINQVPEKRPETERPTVIDHSSDPEREEEKKMGRAADRAAHKGNKTEQQYDQDHNTFSI